jgi:hypothetical protein
METDAKINTGLKNDHFWNGKSPTKSLCEIKHSKYVQVLFIWEKEQKIYMNFNVKFV